MEKSIEREYQTPEGLCGQPSDIMGYPMSSQEVPQG